MVGLHHGRERIEQEGAIPELAQPDAHAGEGLEVTADKFRIAYREFHGLGQEESLGGRLLARLEPLEHLFEEDAFVGGVLVEQDQAALGFEQHVETAHDADDSQRALEQGNGQRTCCHRERGDGLAGIGGLGLAVGRHRAQGHGRRWGRRDGAGERFKRSRDRGFGSPVCRHRDRGRGGTGTGFRNGRRQGRSRIGFRGRNLPVGPRG